MASSDDVKKLAALSRIEVKEADLEKFSKEFDGILNYIGQIANLSIDIAQNQKPTLRNAFRVDGEPHESGIYTEKLAEQFSGREENYLKVKQIISHD